MTDIVWNLRNDVPCNGDIGCAWELCNQAADEITRLRAREAELVEALEDIADGMGEDDPVEIGKYAPAIARAALGDDK
jgi:hypothetical protein